MPTKNTPPGPRSRSTWTAEEDEVFLGFRSIGLPYTYISVLMGRTVAALMMHSTALKKAEAK